VVKGLAREELNRESWLRMVARESNRSYKQMRVAVLEFLETDIFSITPENCIAFLNPLIMSWDIDLASFALQVVLNRKIVSARVKKFEFVEQEARVSPDEEPGLREFLDDRSLSGNATPEELDFLRQLCFKNGRRPTALYYYRELQNFRDPLHFRRDKKP